jgi:UDP-glucose 4-epimerase
MLAGGAGYIGSHTAVVLSQAGHDVIIYDNFVNSDICAVEHVRNLIERPIPYIAGDISDVQTLIHALRSYCVDMVVHFAGLKSVSDSIKAPIEYFENNITGTIRLISAMNHCGIHRLVFSSSATVYGHPQYLPLDELHPVGVTNPYGRSKLHIEQILADLATSDSRWQISCLRYFNPVGSHKSGLIGEISHGVPNNLMPYITKVASGELERLFIFGGDYDTVDGTGVRDYIHVMDLAEGHLRAVEKLMAEGANYEIYNLGTGAGVSVLQLIEIFEKVNGIKIPYEIIGRRMGDVGLCFADVRKAGHKLGWSAKLGIDEMCKSAWAFRRITLTSL